MLKETGLPHGYKYQILLPPNNSTFQLIFDMCPDY